MQKTSLRPILKWAGGKTFLVPYLKPLWEKSGCDRWVSPFCGGLGDVLGVIPSRALLNDISPHLINLYTWIQKGLRLEIDARYDQNLYYEYRDLFNQLIQEKQANTELAAQLFYILNRCCFNGLCRFSKKKKLFNTPFGAYKTVNFIRNFSPYQEIFKDWKFKCGDFELVKLRQTDFVYIDPPYLEISSSANFTQYNGDRFTWEDQERLACWASAHCGKVVASNHALPEIIELYKTLGFEIQLLDAPRRISCRGDRTPVREILAMKGFS